MDVKCDININKSSLLILKMWTRTRAHCRTTRYKRRRTRSQKGGVGERESAFLSLADAALSPDLQEVTRSSSMYAEPGDVPKNVDKGDRSVKSMEIERNTNNQVLVYILGGFVLGGITYAISNSVDIKQ